MAVGGRIVVLEQKEFNFFAVSRPLWTEFHTSLPFLPGVEGHRPKGRQDLVTGPDGYLVCGGLQLMIDDSENHFGRLTDSYVIGIVPGFP